MASRVLSKVIGKNLPADQLVKTWKIVKGDTVQMMLGPDKGKQGKVVKVIRSKNRLVVEGINVTKRHAKKGLQDTSKDKMGYYKAESPVHYCHVKLVDPIDKKPTKVSFKFNEAGEKLRVSKRTGNIIPKPQRLMDLKYRKTVGPKDTDPAVVLQQTFDPDTLNPLLEVSLRHQTHEITGVSFQPPAAAAAVAAAAKK
eukprot:TRINITY_DN4209_c0_g1_i1.p1 TRINITY_DN4209_c0_g1~~TRINITY_DN4209_c0_g1_i1.p1  ORF type:complete len:209 (-),score=59.82 TRINITY_DN4209_c0_g1_i1:222-815(-)